MAAKKSRGRGKKTTARMSTGRAAPKKPQLEEVSDEEVESQVQPEENFESDPEVDTLSTPLEMASVEGVISDDEDLDAENGENDGEVPVREKPTGKQRGRPKKGSINGTQGHEEEDDEDYSPAKSPAKSPGKPKGRPKKRPIKSSQDDEDDEDEDIPLTSNGNVNGHVAKRPANGDISNRATPGNYGGGDTPRVHCLNFARCKGIVTGTRPFVDVWCNKCLPWAHPYKVSEQLFYEDVEDDCVFCSRLENVSKVENIEYKNLESYPARWTDSLKSERKQEEMPKGHPDDWNFYINYNHEFQYGLLHITRKMNVKVGDCVFLVDKNKEGLDRMRSYAVRVQYIVKDVNDDIFISGYDIYAPRQVASKLGKDEIAEMTEINPKMMFTDIDSHVWAPLSAVSGECVLLYKDDYDIGWPAGFSKADTFYLSHDFDWNMTWMSNLKGTDFQACTNRILYVDKAKK